MHNKFHIQLAVLSSVHLVALANESPEDMQDFPEMGCPFSYALVRIQLIVCTAMST